MSRRARPASLALEEAILGLHAPSAEHSDVSCFSTPSTVAGWLAPALAAAAIALGVIGELTRGEGVGPYYRVAFLVALLGGTAGVVAVRRGERSLVTILAFVPFAIVVAFGVAQLFV